MRVIGFTYDASVHCVDCTYYRFDGSEDRGATDTEGNEVHPIFETDEDSFLEHCDDCRLPLIAHDCDEHGRWEVGYEGSDIGDSARFQEHEDAKRWLIRELEEHADNVDSWADPPNHDCEEMGHEDDSSCPRQVANQLTFLAEDLNLISEGRTFDAVMAGVRYWIKTAEE
ncbi:MAG TPA: hypothetical protein VFA45_15980 [Actinomycetes bacterium]|nr:hypothetical protein [Actinomycetes bacterium]